MWYHVVLSTQVPFHSAASLRKSIFEDVLLGSMPRSLPAPAPVKSAWQWDVGGCDSDGYADTAEVGVKGREGGRRKRKWWFSYCRQIL